MFLLTALLGYCHCGWSVPIHITYDISMDYDASFVKTEKDGKIVKTKKYGKFINGKASIISIDDIRDDDLKILLNNTYPIKITTGRESIADQTFSGLFPNFDSTSEEFDEIVIKRRSSQFTLNLKDALTTTHKITIDNSLMNASIYMNVKSTSLEDNSLVGCTKRKVYPWEAGYGDWTISEIVQSESTIDCKGISLKLTYNPEEGAKYKMKELYGEMEFVFDYNHKLKDFLNKPSTPTGLYRGEVTYDGESLIPYKDRDKPVANPEKYTFKFKINKLRKLTSNVVWDGGKDSISMEPHAKNNNADIVRVYGHKLFSLRGMFNPLDTFKLKFRSSPGSTADGCNDDNSSEFLLVNEEAKKLAETDSCQRVCIPSKLNFNNEDDGFHYPIHNGKNKEVAALKDNLFKCRLNFEFYVPCEDFTKVSSALRFTLHAGNGQETKITDPPSNPFARPETLNLAFNLQCGSKSLTFKIPLTAEITLQNPKQ